MRSVCGDGAQAEAEIAAIRDEAAAAAALGGGQHFWARLRRLWTERELRRAVLLGIGLMALNQLSGINTVMYYSATVLVGAGFSARVAVWIERARACWNLLHGEEADAPPPPPPRSTPGFDRAARGARSPPRRASACRRSTT